MKKMRWNLQKAKRNLYDLYLEEGFRVIHLPGNRAIAWIRRYIPHAIETAAQEQLVIDYETKAR